MMIKIENEEFGLVEIVELKQKHVDAYWDGLDDSPDTKMGVFRGRQLRAAITAGWFVSPALKTDDVDNMEPRKVVFLALCVEEAVKEVYKDIPLPFAPPPITRKEK